jgi:hypothetical protein
VPTQKLSLLDGRKCSPTIFNLNEHEQELDAGRSGSAYLKPSKDSLNVGCQNQHLLLTVQLMVRCCWRILEGQNERDYNAVPLHLVDVLVV